MTTSYNPTSIDTKYPESIPSFIPNKVPIMTKYKIEKCSPIHCECVCHSHVFNQQHMNKVPSLNNNNKNFSEGVDRPHSDNYLNSEKFHKHLSNEILDALDHDEQLRKFEDLSRGSDGVKEGMDGMMMNLEKKMFNGGDNMSGKMMDGIGPVRRELEKNGEKVIDVDSFGSKLMYGMREKSEMNRDGLVTMRVDLLVKGDMNIEMRDVNSVMAIDSILNKKGASRNRNKWKKMNYELFNEMLVYEKNHPQVKQSDLQEIFNVNRSTYWRWKKKYNH